MKILITGINGFVGQALREHLSEAHTVYSTYNSGEAKFENSFRVDLTVKEEVENLFAASLPQMPDVIIHLAAKMATVDQGHDLDILSGNAAMAQHIAAAAKQYDVKQLMNFSSSSVYPNIDGEYRETDLPDPSHNTDAVYGLSKWNSEVLINMILKPTKIAATHLRVAMIHGKGMNQTRIIPVFEQELAQHNTITVFGNGERLINQISIEKLARYVSHFIENPVNDTLNVSEEAISLQALAERIIAKKGNADSTVICVPRGSRNKFVLNTDKLQKLVPQL